MFEIILLAGSVSVELEPYAVENPEADSYRIESNTDAYGRPYQWSTLPEKSAKSILILDDDRSEDYIEGVNRDAFGRPTDGED
jgi:hypothetical protein